MTEANRDTETPAQEPGKAAVRPEEGFEGVALCAEAQADGVPCTELGRRCEECERVAQAAEPDAW